MQFRRVKHRCNRQPAVSGRKLRHGDQDLALLDQIAVTVHQPLGFARGTAGVHDGKSVLFVHIDIHGKIRRLPDHFPVILRISL